MWFILSLIIMVAVEISEGLESFTSSIWGNVIWASPFIPVTLLGIKRHPGKLWLALMLSAGAFLLMWFIPFGFIAFTALLEWIL